ncbi:extracellular solute-binding protein [Paenibacillus sp. NPDC057967]|uniref:extracellular solute-binding protein n=1 Tax=Paenibacillus sp. NPDC057967 TaxID=3346293 RepID=UPI0036DA945A
MTLRMMRSSALMAMLALLLSGCLGNSIIDDPGTVKRLGDEPQKTIVIWHTYSDEETILFEKEVIPAFEAEHPGIVIESVRQTHNQEYHSALQARASAGKTPDIIRMDYTWIPVFAQRELLYPIESFPGYAEVSDQLQGRMMNTNRYAGHVYGLPLNMTTKAALYNVQLLEKLDISEPPTSFAETVKLAREHGYSLGMSDVDLWNSLPYFFALGGNLADPSFSRTEGYLNSPASVSAMKELLKLHKEGIINPWLLKGNADLWREVYAPGRFLMIDEGPWYYSILLNIANTEVDLLQRTKPVPFPSDGEYRSIMGGESLVMTKGARNKEEAWTFMSWMANKQTQLKLMDAGLIPANTEAFEAGRHSDNPVIRYLAPYMEGIEDAFYRPPIPQWNEIEKLYNTAMEDIFMRGKDVEETLDDTARKMDALLGSS